MADLDAAERKKIPSSKFGLPGDRKYPMPDRAHASNAKARAEQQFKKGNLSGSEKAKIDRKANRVLYGSAREPESDGAKKVARAMMDRKR